jgi:broad specificity phosphatase PhoE
MRHDRPERLSSRDSERPGATLPATGLWFSSPEPKALKTARMLTAAPVTVVSGLSEMARPAGWYEDFDSLVAQALATPDRPAAPGWETAASTLGRVARAVDRIATKHEGEVLILAGHGTAWTLLASALTGAAPDMMAWKRLLFPDHVVIADREVVSAWGAWVKS